MSRSDAVSRRTALAATGGAVCGTLLAGCTGGDDGPAEVEIEPGTRMVFRATQANWIGKAPAKIEDERDPTLILTEGETYTLGWDEGDGATHNIRLLDSDNYPVQPSRGEEKYSTPVTPTPSETESFIEFEALAEIAYYSCNGHGDKKGEIIVE